MIEHLKNIIPKILEFSESISKNLSITNQPWVSLDGLYNQYKFIFKSNNELIISIHGNASIGKWEYLSSAKSLLISFNSENLLLNILYIDNGLIILKRDGEIDSFFLLVNQNIVTDGNVINYLEKKHKEKNIKNVEKTKKIELLNGDILVVEMTKDNNDLIGSKLKNYQNVQNGRFISRKIDFVYVIHENTIRSINPLKKIELSNNKFIELERDLLYEYEDFHIDFPKTVIGKYVTEQGKPINDCILSINKKNTFYQIRNSKVEKIYFSKMYKIDKNCVKILLTINNNKIKNGDIVIDKNYENGIFSIDSLKTITVANGIIVDIKYKYKFLKYFC